MKSWLPHRPSCNHGKKIILSKPWKKRVILGNKVILDFDNFFLPTRCTMSGSTMPGAESLEDHKPQVTLYIDPTSCEPRHMACT